MKKLNEWMKAVDGSTFIDDITIPGTHDSATRYISFSFISRTQGLTVKQQLEAGCRYFDFRFRNENGIFSGQHSFCTCRKGLSPFSDVLTADDIVGWCVSFLRENPSETILFQLREEHGSSGLDFFDAFYEKYIKPQRDKWFTENRIPCLDEVRGKIILLRVVAAGDSYDDSNSGINFTSYPHIEGLEMNDWRKSIITDKKGNPVGKLHVQDSYRLEGSKKWKTATGFLDCKKEKGEIKICLTSCVRHITPFFNAMILNRKLKKYEFSSNDGYGIVVTDFFDSEIGEKIVNLNL